MSSDERLTIDTPEQVALELSIAGIGSRFLAVAVDTVLQAIGYLAVFVAIALLSASRGTGRRSALLLVGPVIAVLVVFCIYWGYFAFFEFIWSGRTPGKRVAGIRVIKESGRPINAYEAIARNVLRAIDFLPAAYGVGIVCMMLNRNSRRIGDYVAGTLVVHDKPIASVRPDWHRSTDVDASRAPLTEVTDEELLLIETYMQRRFDLDPLVRDDMADQIAARISAKTGLRRDPNEPVDAYLQAVARRVRDTARFR